MTTSALPTAVVFDCDGTLADTERLAEQAWQLTLREHDYEPSPADFAAVIGRPFPWCWDYFAGRADLGEQAAFVERLRTRFERLFDEDLDLHPDTVATMRALAEAGVPLAMASSSSHRHVLAVLERGDLRELVSVVVGADDVPHHKPDPTPYVVAARDLGLPAERCTAVEDTGVGVAAGRAAGMFTVAVLRPGIERATLAEADRVVDEVTVAALVPERQEVAS
ncbi:HAD family hydrolase [Egicoccus halophilus]|uniref:Hydrolase n=1 Tax=Egicoccus halophilus TaxID=1670830 RepID=A0A8J3EY49_9ACTN|nr:HAD family phosphatase [Egicoccus halophilus]GGI07155.1 hydrolase [Egicoccus halophilus]